MKPLLTLFIGLFVYTGFAQSFKTSVPYSDIGEYAQNYEPGNVVARFIDGLGYRYHWASKDLTQKDLEYKPSENGRTTLETLVHICGLSQTIADAANGRPSIMPFPFSDLNYERLRTRTLNNFRSASKALNAMTAEQIAQLKVVFKSGDNSNEFPFWNMLNGPISDAIYHTGQVVVLRRASGNPMDPNVSVLMGKNKTE